jgi:exopolysaccharide biosynthesis predicted pyruvyltransferase EpsI
MYDKALTEIETVYAMDPGNAEAREYEQSVLTIQRKAEEARSVSEQRSQQSDAWRKEEEDRRNSAEKGREVLHRESVNTYRSMMLQAWASGEPLAEDRSMLDVVRLSLGILEFEHKKIEHDVRVETYTDALRAALKSGAMSPDDSGTVEQLRKVFSITTDEDGPIQSALKAELKNNGRRT